MQFSGTEIWRSFSWMKYAWVDIDVFDLEEDEYLSPEVLLEALIHNPRFHCNYIGMDKGASIGVHSAFLITSMKASSYKQVTADEAKELIMAYPQQFLFQREKGLVDLPFEPDDIAWLEETLFPPLENAISIFHLIKEGIEVEPMLDGFQEGLIELVIIRKDSLWLTVITDD